MSTAEQQRKRYAWRIANEPRFRERTAKRCLKYNERARRKKGAKPRPAPMPKKESRRRSNLKRYGLTLADYAAILTQQEGLCAICRQPETTRNNFGPIPLAVDHCHKTKRVRGLLCAHCNRAIGLMKESPQRLIDAAAYLRRE